MSADHPQFGRQRVQVLPSGEAVVQATSETFQAKPGEDQKAFLRRLAREHGVGPGDVVEVVFKAGRPQYAVVEWGKRKEEKA